VILDRFRQLGGREQVAIAAACLAALFWMADVLVFGPLWKRTSDLKALAEVERGKLEYARTVLAGAEGTAEAYDEVREMVGRALSPDEATAQMVGEIDEIAASTGVAISRRQPRSPRKFSYCEEHALDVADFTATGGQLAAFLHGIQQSRGLLRVAYMKVSVEKGESGRLKGAMVITKLVAPENPGG